MQIPSQGNKRSPIAISEPLLVAATAVCMATADTSRQMPRASSSHLIGKQCGCSSLNCSIHSLFQPPSPADVTADLNQESQQELLLQMQQQQQQQLADAGWCTTSRNDATAVPDAPACDGCAATRDARATDRSRPEPRRAEAARPPRATRARDTRRSRRANDDARDGVTDRGARRA